MNIPAPSVGSPHPVPHIGFGHVWHTRLRPRRHRFSVPTFFLLLPMRTLHARPEAAGVLALNRTGALSASVTPTTATARPDARAARWPG